VSARTDVSPPVDFVAAAVEPWTQKGRTRASMPGPASVVLQWSCRESNPGPPTDPSQPLRA
jgi:hypothetical protein